MLVSGDGDFGVKEKTREGDQRIEKEMMDDGF